MIIDNYLQQLQEAEGMHELPKGWTHKSVKKFAKSLTGKEGPKKGFFDRCVKKMRGHVSNPEAFCASVKDETAKSTYWRGKGKSPQQAAKDIKAHKNVKVEMSTSLIENFLQSLYTDNRSQAKEWRGPNIPYGDDSNRPNLIRQCMTLESNQQKINCLRKLRDQAAMNPFYQSRLDRFVDTITGICQ